MNTDLDALATRLYVTIDDLLIDHPEWAPERPAVGIAPKLTDAELITLAVIQALLGFTSEARFIRHANIHLRCLFPYLPQRPAYNKRLRHATATMQHLIATLARDCPSWHHGGRKPAGVCARILQRLLALTTAIWHNETTRQPGPARSLLAYDH